VKRKQQAGFSMLETMVALAILLIVTAIVMTGMAQMLNTQALVSNRTEMHSSVRNATELLQQEIGQAGKVSLGDPNANVTLNAATAVGGGVSFTLNTSTGVAPVVYPGELLTFDLGNNQETVTLAGTSAAPTGTFTNTHAAGTPVFALGAFSTGIVPPTAAPASYANGSTGTVLKLYGDINGDGNMLYVEYTCTAGTSTAPGTLSRNEIAITAATKPAVDNTMTLLGNILTNPVDVNNNAVPCFQYQVQQLGAGYVVTDVAVTLTVQTQVRDPQTGQFQPETKALLN
jgi:prepilin-type N-terminal cleavage/methylation domain-containing protein